LILVGGSFGDLFGRRLIFVVSVSIFAMASAGCGFASNIHQLIIARSIQGVRLGSAAYHTKVTDSGNLKIHHRHGKADV
jgi:MFS family permease